MTEPLIHVERFDVTSERHDAYGDEVVLTGWMLTPLEVTGFRLVSGSKKTFEIRDRNLPSADVAERHGDTHGEGAAHARFRLRELIGIGNPVLETAFFVVEFVDGNTVQIPVGREPARPDRSDYTDAEHALVMRFENIGDNCELGLVQRVVGRERLALFRYAGVGDVGAVADAIEDRFAFLDEPEAVLAAAWEGEWIVHVPRARLTMHTGRSIQSIGRDEIERAELTKIRYLAGRFLAACERGGTTFVHRVHYDRRGGDHGTRGMDRLHGALRTMGRNNLLWVNRATPAEPHGMVAHLGDGLFRGWIDHLAPLSNAYDFRPRSWLTLLANAEAAIEGAGSD